MSFYKALGQAFRSVGQAVEALGRNVQGLKHARETGMCCVVQQMLDSGGCAISQQVVCVVIASASILFAQCPTIKRSWRSTGMYQHWGPTCL